jgi:hypothetical protein
MTRKQTPLWLVKTRCAVVGAAVAVTFGLGGLDFASATVSAGERSVFVPVVPCRLVDTRPAPSTVGDRGVPIVKDEQFQVLVRGKRGNCNVSSGATAVVLNVTALDARGNGFLTVWPAENERPNTSNLNFSNRQAPVANAVTVKIDSQGAIKFSTSSNSLNIIADVVGYFEDHSHADAYKPKGTVLGTTVFPTTTTLPATTTTTLPATTTTTTIPPVIYDVPDTGSPITNGTNLRAFLATHSSGTVTLAPVGYIIGDQPLNVPSGVLLTGVASNLTYIRGESLPALSRPILTMSAGSTLTGLGVVGTSGGAGVRADTNTSATTFIRNVSINVSQDLEANGAVENAGSGTLRMTNVRTRSRYGVNNGTGSIVIIDSDIDGVVQNAAGGDISVTASIIGFDTLWPESGATAYKTGLVKLTNVTVYSASVGVSAVDLLSKVDVQGGSILSRYPRKLPSNPTDELGVTLCNNVAKPPAVGGTFLSNCT